MRRTPIRSALLMTVVFLAACSGLRPAGRLDSAPRADLAALQQNPDLAGPRIYEGSVVAIDRAKPTELFRYQRRVRPDSSGLVSTHITRDSAGRVVVLQRATHTPTYQLTRADLVHAQTGWHASVAVSGSNVEFTLTEAGVTSTAHERVDAPVVAGPTMFGFVLEHWVALERGESVRIRFAVPERKQTIGFVLDRVERVPGQTTIRMRATSLLLRAFVPTTYFNFDAESRHILGYEGAVPPMERVGDQLRPFTARVDYSSHASMFR